LANFNEHIEHSKKNLDFLTKINSSINERWDWQVTVCFYTALHLMNAHIFSKTNANFLSHHKVEAALNPFSFSPAKVDETTFLSYNKLAQLSRRSRYLLKENFNPSDDIQLASLTHSPHFKRAIHHLDIVISYINNNYGNLIGKTDVGCSDLNGLAFSNFEIIQVN
jgi:hypothetical protein